MALIVDDPHAVVARAIAAGAREVWPVAEEYGWVLGRIEDPYGHHWEIGKPPRRLARRSSLAVSRPGTARLAVVVHDAGELETAVVPSPNVQKY